VSEPRELGDDEDERSPNGVNGEGPTLEDFKFSGTFLDGERCPVICDDGQPCNYFSDVDCVNPFNGFPDVDLKARHAKHQGAEFKPPKEGPPYKTVEVPEDSNGAGPHLIDVRLLATLGSHTHTLTAEDFDREPEPVRCLWGYYIPSGEVSVLNGQGGAGKTSLLTGLAIAGAAGQSFLGRPTLEFSTVIFSTEDGIEAYQRKLHAWRSTYPGIWRQVRGRIHLVNLKGVELRLIETKFGGSQFVPGVVEALASHTRKLVPDGEVLIPIETVSRVSGGDESNGAGSMLIVAMERLALLTKGGTPLPVAHVGKSNSRERVVDMYSSRGASALPDNARSVFVLSRPPEDVLTKAGIAPGDEPDYLFGLFHAKHNYTPKEPDLLLRRENGKHAAFFDPWEAAHRPTGVAGETEEAGRALVGERLREVVRSLLDPDGRDKREFVTANMLRDQYRERLGGIVKAKVTAEVAKAVADHWLRQGEKRAQGGGYPLFPDDPARHQKSPDGSRPEVARSRPGELDQDSREGPRSRSHPLKGKTAWATSKSVAPPKSPGSRPGEIEEATGAEGEEGGGDLDDPLSRTHPSRVPDGPPDATAAPTASAASTSLACVTAGCVRPRFEGLAWCFEHWSALRRGNGVDPDRPTEEPGGVP
jgi:RecA-family ATPase